MAIGPGLLKPAAGQPGVTPSQRPPAGRLKTMTGWAARHPVVTFYAVAFGISWVAWFPQTLHALGVPGFASSWFASPALFIVGGFGPGVAAYLLLRLRYGEDAGRQLWRAATRLPTGAGWLAAAVLGYVAVWLLAAALDGSWTRELAQVTGWVAMAPTLLLYVVQAVPEEVGWRGFAQPHLQTRYSALTASLIVGVLWALWHLPLRLDPDEIASSSSQLGWAVATIAAAVLYGWLFNSTGGSMLAVIVLHAVANTASTRVTDMAGDVETALAVVTIVVAAVLVAGFGARDLSRRPRVTDVEEVVQ